MPASISTGVNGETLDINYGSTGDTTTAHIGSYAITGTLSSGTGQLSDYSVTLTNGALTVNPFAFTYLIGNDSQTYGSPANLGSDLPASISTGVNGETLDINYGSTGDTTTAHVGSYAITGALSSGSGQLSDYSVTLTNGTLTVNPFAFTYLIGNDGQTYGSPANLAADLPATISTGINGETLDITYGSTGDTTTAHVGSEAITGNLANGTGLTSDYSATLTNGILTISPFAFSYIIGNDSQTYGSPANLAADLPATISTGVNGESLDITYGTTGDSTTAHVGSYAITGTLSSGTGQLSDYSVTLTNGALTVNPFAFNYTIGNDSQTYGSSANLTADLPATISTGVNGETLDITYGSTGDNTTAHVGSYAITGALSSGTGQLSDYAVTLTSGALTVSPFAFTYLIGNDSQTYGSPANLSGDLPATISTGVNGETLDITYGSTGDTTTAHVGSYAITGALSSGTGQSSDYSVKLANGTLTVNPFAFSYTIGNASQLFGQPANLAEDLPDTIPTGVNGEELAINYGSTGDTNTSYVGNYAIVGTLSDNTGQASDYTVTLSSGTLTVAPLPVDITGADVGGVLVTPVVAASFTVRVGSFQPSFAATASDFTASIDWGDGTSTAGVITANSTGGFDVAGTHSYAIEETVPVVLTVTQTISGAVYSVAREKPSSSPAARLSRS